MIGTIDIKVNSASPQMPLPPLYAFVGSPSQVRIINVPRAIGNWRITAVNVVANYPDNQLVSVAATNVGGCWSATLSASAAVGQSLNGFAITANGVSESGAAVSGYILGKGDVFVLNADSTITVGSTTYYLHLLDSIPASPHKGDVCVIEGVVKFYNGSAWVAFGSTVTSISWDNVTGKPSTFPPSAHTHVKADVTDFAHTHVKSDVTDFPTAMTPTEHAASHATNGSDPISASDIGALGLWHIDDPSAHFAIIQGRAPAVHTHVKSSISDFAHTHVKSDVTDFPTSMTPTPHMSTHIAGGSDAILPMDIGALSISHNSDSTAHSSLFADKAALVHSHVAANVTDFGSSVDARLPYATAPATAALADRTCNAVTVTSSAVTLTFPAAVSGKMRDFLVYVDASGFATGGALTITLPSGATHFGDDFPAVAAAGEHLIAVTEIAANKFFVKAIELEEVA